MLWNIFSVYRDLVGSNCLSPCFFFLLLFLVNNILGCDWRVSEVKLDAKCVKMKVPFPSRLLFLVSLGIVKQLLSGNHVRVAYYMSQSGIIYL